MSISHQQRQKDLARWLQENVKRYKTPRIVTLSKFTIDTEEFEGTFHVTLDEDPIPDEFSFGIEGNGSPTFYLPTFHSPLGVPASFPAIHLTTDTEDAIEAGLKIIIPKLRPFGLHKESGRLIDARTPIDERIVEPDKLELFLKISKSRRRRLVVDVATKTLLAK